MHTKKTRTVTIRHLSNALGDIAKWLAIVQKALNRFDPKTEVPKKRRTGGGASLRTGGGLADTFLPRECKVEVYDDGCPTPYTKLKEPKGKDKDKKKVTE